MRGRLRLRSRQISAALGMTREGDARAFRYASDLTPNPFPPGMGNNRAAGNHPAWQLKRKLDLPL